MQARIMLQIVGNDGTVGGAEEIAVLTKVTGPCLTTSAPPIRHHLVLHRRDPERRLLARFYSLMIERDLFGVVCLVRNWGRIGTSGQEMVEVFADELEAGEALEAVARRKRRRGYRDL